GIDAASLSVTADIVIDGRAPGTELAGLAVPVEQGISRIPLSAPLASVTDAHLLVTVSDNQGNISRVNRKFSVGSGGPVPSPTTPRPTLTPRPTATPASGTPHDSAVLPRLRPVR